MVQKVNSRLRSTLSPEAEADTAQEVFIQLWDRLSAFQGRSTLEGWAWSFAKNHTRNSVRKVVSERYRRDAWSEGLEHQADPDEVRPIITRRTAELWLQCISPRMAEVIRWKHFDGLLFREIAEKLSLSENTVKARYYRGLKQLRAALSREQGHDGISRKRD